MELRNSFKKLPFEEEMKEQTILRELSQFIRKEPDQNGAFKLQHYSKNSDLSYAQTLITAANRYFGQALKQWCKYQQKIQEHLTNFMNNIHTKIYYSKLTHLQYIFKPLRDLYKKITKKEVVLLNEDTILQQSDQVVQKYVKQKESQMHRTQSERANNFVGDTDEIQDDSSRQHVLVPLKMIGNKLEDSRPEVWKQIFFKVNLFYSPFFRLFSSLPNTLSDQKRTFNNEQNGKNFFKNLKTLKDTNQWKQLQNKEDPNVNHRDCACCLSYVYQDQDLSFPAFPQPVAFLTNIVNYALLQHQIKGQIVSFLNGKGGVIFLGCKRTKDGCIIPQLDVTLQLDKSKAQDTFRSYINDIFPSVQLKRHIDLTFIPVAQSVANSPKRQLKWKPGVYILRIVISPLEPQNTYYFKYQDNFHFTKQSSNKVVQVKKQQIYQFMKKRYTQYNVKINGRLRERGNIIPTVVKHNGACRGVEKGKPEYGTHFQIDRAQNMMQGKVSNPLLIDRQTYKSVSLLVVDQTLVAEIKKIFSQKQKLQAVIDTAFPSKKFRLSNNTWLVWHNVKFQKLMAGLKKEQNQLKQKNSRKPVLLISTCSCVKSLYQGQLSKQIVEDVKKFAEKQSKQKVEFKQINDYDYFKTTSNITAVLIYYYLNHRYQIKSVFQKIPTGSGSEVKHKHVKGNQLKLNHTHNQKKAKNIKQPDHNADYDQNNYGHHQEQQIETHSLNRKQTLVDSNQQQYYQPIYSYNQVAYSKQIDSPKVLLQRYDEYYNVWRVYYNNNFVYFFNTQNIPIDCRTYEQSQLQLLQQLQQQQHQYYS